MDSTKRLSLSITPTSSTSSGLANRRRNNKNLSLCLPETNSSLLLPLKTATKQQKDDVNAYPLGPAKIMPYLYLGSEKNTLDLDHLKQLNIQAILNVAAEVNNPYEYMFQSMDDMLAQAITPSPSLSKASSVSSTASSIQTIPSTSFDAPVAYQKIPWQHNQDNLAVELIKAIDIIDRARAAGQTILVHCQCGVARSATVIIAYVMKTLKMPMQEAYNHVKRLAPPISPNLSLLFQLREFEQKTLMACIPEQIVVEEPMLVDQPKSWVYNDIKPIKKQPSFLSASSIGSWKRKLTKSTKSIFSTNHDEEDGWWKTRKVSFDSPQDTPSPCC
jgi:hypothetical protein